MLQMKNTTANCSIKARNYFRLKINCCMILKIVVPYTLIPKLCSFRKCFWKIKATAAVITIFFVGSGSRTNFLISSSTTLLECWTYKISEIHLNTVKIRNISTFNTFLNSLLHLLYMEDPDRHQNWKPIRIHIGIKTLLIRNIGNKAIVPAHLPVTNEVALAVNHVGNHHDLIWTNGTVFGVKNFQF